MDNIVIRPLTEADILDFYKACLPKPCRGWAIDYNGYLVAIVGVTIGDVMLAWSDIRKGVRIPPRVIWETAQILMGKISDLRYPMIYAVAKKEIKTAPAFLRRLGWVHTESGSRGEIFLWQIPSR